MVYSYNAKLYSNDKRTNNCYTYNEQISEVQGGHFLVAEPVLLPDLVTLRGMCTWQWLLHPSECYTLTKVFQAKPSQQQKIFINYFNTLQKSLCQEAKFSFQLYFISISISLGNDNAIEVSVLWMARAHCIHFSLWPKYMRSQNSKGSTWRPFSFKTFWHEIVLFSPPQRSSSYSYKVTLSHFSLLISSLLHMQRENINVHQLQFMVSKFKLGIYGWNLCSSRGIDRNQFPFPNLVCLVFTRILVGSKA